MADVSVTASFSANQTTRGKRRMVMATASVGYFFYVDSTATAFGYVKTTDGGANWGSFVAISGATTPIAFDVWFDQWTPGDSGTKIHTWYFDVTGDDVLWRSLDTSGDSLGTERVCFAGVSAAANRGTFCSGTKAVSGYLYVAFDIDAGAEMGLMRSTDSGTSWGTNLSATFVEATIDECLLFPASGTGDNNDIWAIYQDADADQLTIKMWDSSAASAIESASLQTMVENVTDGLGQGGFSGSIRHSDGHLIVVSMSEYDTVTADMQVWDVSAVNAGSSTGITTKTAITTNIDDIYYPCVFIDQTTNNIYVAYNGKRDGSENVATAGASKPYYTKSTDGGATWTSGDTTYSEASTQAVTHISAPLMGARFIFVFRVSTTQYTSFVNSVTFAAALTSSLSGALSFVGADAMRTSKGMTAAIAFTGAVAKRIARQVSGAVSFVGALQSVRLLLRTLTATLSFVGAQKDTTAKALAGSVSFIGATAKRSTRALSGALSFIGATAKRGTRALSGAVSFAGALSKTTAHKFTAALSFAGTFASQLIGGAVQYTKALTAALSFSGAQTKFTSKRVAGAVAFIGTAAKTIPRAFTGALSFVGSLRKGNFESFTAALGFVGSQTRLTRKAFAAAVNLVGAMGKTMGRSLAGSVAFVGSVRKSSAKALSASVAFVGNMRRTVAHKMAAALTFAGNFITQIVGGPVQNLKALTAALVLSGATRKATAHKMAGAVSFLGAFGRRIPRALAGAVAFSGNLARKIVITRLFTASISFVGAQYKSTRTALSAATLSFAGVFTKFVPGLALIFRNRRASRGIGI